MKRLGFALATLALLTLPGWGERLKPGEQAHASVADHRSKARYNEGRHQGRRHHRHHHKKHQSA